MGATERYADSQERERSSVSKESWHLPLLLASHRQTLLSSTSQHWMCNPPFYYCARLQELKRVQKIMRWWKKNSKGIWTAERWWYDNECWYVSRLVGVVGIPIYGLVPVIEVTGLPSLTMQATLKSVRWICPWESSNIFAGLRSRWMIRLFCR